MNELASALARLARVPVRVGEDISLVTDALTEAVACVHGLWEWQRGTPELLPDELVDRVKAVLIKAGIAP